MKPILRRVRSRVVAWALLGSSVIACFWLQARAQQAGPKGETAELLEALLPGSDPSRRSAAIRRVKKSDDQRFIAPLIDRLKFVKTREELRSLVGALRKLTGEKVSPFEQPWEDFAVWYGKQGDLQPPPGYTAWKGELYAREVDPRFRILLYDNAPSTIRVEEITWGGVKPAGIPALVDPAMIPSSAAAYLTAADPVFGISINGDHRAYPLRILDWHEMANDVVGGRPVALAYCTLCGAGILFDAEVADTRLRFGSSGLLYRSNKLMFDENTLTLWNQITGEPVLGRLAGRGVQLKILPLVLTSWGEWKSQHPSTKVLDPETGHERRYEPGAAYGRYFASPDTMFPVWQQSRIMPKKARIFALRVNGIPKAYPLDALNRAGGIVNDTVGGSNLVVVYRDAVGKVPLPESWREALARQGGRFSKIEYANDLTFEAAEAVLNKKPALTRDMSAEFLLAMPAKARLLLLKQRTPDRREGKKAPKGKIPPNLRNEVAVRGLIGETRAYERNSHTFELGDARDTLKDERGRSWRITEEALLGPQEESLRRMGGHLAYWFGWYAFFPQTEVFEAQGR